MCLVFRSTSISSVSSVAAPEKLGDDRIVVRRAGGDCARAGNTPAPVGEDVIDPLAERRMRDLDVGAAQLRGIFLLEFRDLGGLRRSIEIAQQQVRITARPHML